jgi:hypothetical protein
LVSIRHGWSETSPDAAWPAADRTWRMRARAIPRVGRRVIVAFLATRAAGSIERVDADLRGLEVLTDDGERLRFELSGATGIFMATDHSRARLFFDDPAGET